VRRAEGAICVVYRTVAVDDGAADEGATSAAERVVQRVQDHLSRRAIIDRHRLSHVRAAGRPDARVSQPYDTHTHTHTLIVIRPIVAETRLLAPTSKYRQTDRQRDRQTPVERGLFPGQPLTFFFIFRTLFKI